MSSIRRHPHFIAFSGAAAAALALLANADGWSDLGLYAGMVALIAFLGLVAVLLEVRRHGLTRVAGRGGSSALRSSD